MPLVYGVSLNGILPRRGLRFKWVVDVCYKKAYLSETVVRWEKWSEGVQMPPEIFTSARGRVRLPLYSTDPSWADPPLPNHQRQDDRRLPKSLERIFDLPPSLDTITRRYTAEYPRTAGGVLKISAEVYEGTRLIDTVTARVGAIHGSSDFRSDPSGIRVVAGSNPSRQHIQNRLYMVVPGFLRRWLLLANARRGGLFENLVRNYDRVLPDFDSTLIDYCMGKFCQESTMLQFRINADQTIGGRSEIGGPIISGDGRGGAGLGQLTTPLPQASEIWDWRDNVDSTIYYLGNKFFSALNHLEGTWLTSRRIYPSIRRGYETEELLDEIFRFYNGYGSPMIREFKPNATPITINWERNDPSYRRSGDPDYITNIKSKINAC